MNLGRLSTPRLLRESISRTDRADYYRFVAGGRGNFNLMAAGLPKGAKVQLLNRSGALLGNGTGAAVKRISRDLPAGLYYVRIVHPRPAAPFNYRLRLQDDLNWGTVSLGTERRNVALVFADGSTRPISSKRPTWVVIHGWGSSPQGDSTQALAAALQGAEPKGQVLMLDWAQAAADPSVVQASFWANSVGQFAANALQRWGLSTALINVAGHSLGGLVGHYAADLMVDGVNRILAIDPATDFPGLFLSGTNYAADSRYSVGFYASTYATPEAVTTADAAFHVNVGNPDSIMSHVNVVYLVANMIRANSAGAPSAIDILFAPRRLAPRVLQPWQVDAYAGGFEGTLTGQLSAGQWTAKTLVYKNRVTGQTVTMRV